MTSYMKIGNIQVASELYQFLIKEVLPGSGIKIEQFWDGLDQLIHEFSPLNKELLIKRDYFQQKINDWHMQNTGDFEFTNYKEFLREIGYIEAEVPDFQITTEGVDDEIALVAGPQLVVPVNNARYAINAANARWGSLYDALYGTDVISTEDGAEVTKSYNPIRGQKVIDFAKDVLDEAAPLSKDSHKNATKYWVENGQLKVTLKNGEDVLLQHNEKFIGFTGPVEDPSVILLKNNGLHFEIQIDRNHPIGKIDSAGVKDVVLEAAISTIMDFEDSVTAVDTEDKVQVYRNWLGLMKGDLSATFNKGNKQVKRSLHSDRTYLNPQGNEFKLQGRSLMFARNVGHLMTTNAILDKNGQEVPEGIMDTVMTGLIGKFDSTGQSHHRNSRKESIYIVKPKMHGSEEVAFTNELFNRVEDLLGLKRYALKVGVMDEERRTSLNLKNCIQKVKDRIVFINTGFLDRTGDEIHTSMEAAPMVRKGEMKTSTWLNGYEKSNVVVGLDCGFQGRAQIGKGMWAIPDQMKEMVAQKIAHLEAGGNTAWVPSPTAATLHALHYHKRDVRAIQNELKVGNKDYINDILTIPVDSKAQWSEIDIQQELDNNAQSILGYVVRWVEQGIGCSKVPDINNVGLMEDRATLRISSQHMANWLHHGICTEKQVLETMKRMAKVVDSQNVGDPNYAPMAQDYEQSVAFQAACELIFKGYEQPNGYTEPILHRRRLEFKAKISKAIK